MCFSYQELFCGTVHHNSKTLQYQHLGANKLHSGREIAVSWPLLTTLQTYYAQILQN